MCRYTCTIKDKPVNQYDLCVDRYKCTENYCSKKNGLCRSDVIGCLYFCARDVDKSGELSLSEFAAVNNECTGCKISKYEY